MANSRVGQLRVVLKLAKKDEDGAQRDAKSARQRARGAGKEAKESSRRLKELEGNDTMDSDDFLRHRQKATLRANQVHLADEQLRELLLAELEARDQLRGAVRRRRSLEKLEGRRLAVQAGLAAHAAQRALDELATMRRNRGVNDDNR